MIVVYFVVMAWISIHILLSVPRRLPLAVNLLLFLAIEVVLTNKLSYVAFTLGLFQINTDAPHFIALILHNDFTITFILLALVNGFWTTDRFRARVVFVIYGIGAQLLTAYALRISDVLTDIRWSILMEVITVIGLSVYTLLLGWVFQAMASKEGWVR
ncbi:hypothetical protein [Paenibacillus arenilitoris]|uniref:Uncharacterized protein n=1 Tax=Paenibacillus arenilitoris TaxID=2772299 RepID=A0A927CNT5_9BACL|nr:hypothetical protein [Paenibacillus arenilitoris]MBD2870008.1 hypothetical protein [Paenibacillus arenilitoris]